ncbi:MAG: HYR domain-containing protein [Saprospiraceae bacterium]
MATTPLSGHNDVETVTLTADDRNGNTADCSFTVTLQDVATYGHLPRDWAKLPRQIFSGNYTVVDFTGLATASDNCTVSPAKSQSHVPGTVLTVGSHTVTITATDDVSLTGNCTFTLTVQAGCSAATVTCPANQTVAANGFMCWDAG